MASAVPPSLGVVLAGGLARRMGGGDKPLLRLGGQTLLRRVIDRLEPQCAGMIVNANGDRERFSDVGVPVVGDSIPDYAGPLAGVLAAMDWMHTHRPDLSWAVTVPGDTPFIPHDLVLRLHHARTEANAPMACAASDEHIHPAIGLWPVFLKEELRAALRNGQRQVLAWVQSHGAATARWPITAIDPFFNINTPDDLKAAERLAFMCDQEALDRTVTDDRA